MILFIIGDGMIYLFFGQGAAIMGFICLLAGLIPIILIIFALWIIEWIAHRNKPE